MSDLKGIAAILRSDRITHTELADHTGVLLDVDGLNILSLNGAGMFIVKAIYDGVHDIDLLVSEVVEEFDVDAEAARGDIEAFVSKLSRILAPK